MNGLRQPIWLLVVSVLFAAWGVFEVVASREMEGLANDLPRMTCDDLLKMGRAAPQFVALTDVRLCQAGHAFYRDMDAAMQMYVPVYSSKLKKEPGGADLTLLLEVLDDRDRERLLRDPEVGELPIELWTTASQLEPWVETSLAKYYPGIQVAKCRVLSVGLHEPSLPRAAREKRDGIMFMVLGAACLVGWGVWRGMKARFRASVVSSR